MKSNKLYILALVATLSLGAQAETKTDTLIVTPTPKMTCENCVKKIKQNIRFVKGTKNIIVSLPQQTVTIVYDKQKAAYDDYTAAFRKIGYQVKHAAAKK